MNNFLIRNVIKKKCNKVKKYEIKKDAIIYTDYFDKKFVAKKNNRYNDILNTYDYLKSRGFIYIPRLVFANKDGYIYEYEIETKMPKEQKISDLIKMDALLHNKTVYYKDISKDEIKEIYEKLNKKIDNTYLFYDDLINAIESKKYASPGEYMLLRNCSAIFSCLNFSKHSLKMWYDIIISKNKKREVFLHNNLDVSHIIRNNDNVLISWDNATVNLPIYDFIRLYKKDFDKYDFSELYKEYIKRFPLLDEEKKLMFTILFIPWKITFTSSNFLDTKNIVRLCNYLFITDKLFMENEAKNTKEQNHNIDKKQENLEPNT